MCARGRDCLRNRKESSSVKQVSDAVKTCAIAQGNTCSFTASGSLVGNAFAYASFGLESSQSFDFGPQLINLLDVRVCIRAFASNTRPMG